MARPVRDRFSVEVLEAFVAIAESEGHLPLAAEDLGIESQTMWSRLNQLKTPRGGRKPWLEVVGKSWRLTEAGRSVEPAVRDVVRRYRKLDEFAERERPAPTCLDVACGQWAAQTYLRRALGRFRRERPEVRIRVRTVRGRRRIEAVASGAVDLATVTHRIDDINEVASCKLEIEPVRELPMVAVVGSRAPKALRDRFAELPESCVHLEDLAGLPLILPEPDSGLRRIFEAAWRRSAMGSESEGIIEIGGWPMILAMVQDGHGVGVVVGPACVGVARLSTPKPIDPDQLEPAVIQLISRPVSEPADDRQADVQRFRDLLREEAEREGLGTKP